MVGSIVSMIIMMSIIRGRFTISHKMAPFNQKFPPITTENCSLPELNSNLNNTYFEELNSTSVSSYRMLIDYGFTGANSTEMPSNFNHTLEENDSEL